MSIADDFINIASNKALQEASGFTRVYLLFRQEPPFLMNYQLHFSLNSIFFEFESDIIGWKEDDRQLAGLRTLYSESMNDLVLFKSTGTWHNLVAICFCYRPPHGIWANPRTFFLNVQDHMHFALITKLTYLIKRISPTQCPSLLPTDVAHVYHLLRYTWARIHGTWAKTQTTSATLVASLEPPW